MRGTAKQLVPVCTLLFVACAAGPAPENPSAPGAMRPDVDERREARALEQAEAECSRQGKHAVAQRVEGETVYDCAN
jgi:hypothetical protein